MKQTRKYTRAKWKGKVELVCLVCFFMFSSSLLHSTNVFSEAQLVNELNSEKDDYAPSYNLYSNTFYFASDISGISKIYTSKLEKNNFLKAEMINDRLNKINQHLSYITFESPNSAIITIFDKNNKQSYPNLYQAFYRKNEWADQRTIENLNYEGFTAQASVSQDGKSIVFVCNKNSYNNDTDLWIAYKKEDNEWSEPSPLDEVNSRENEITPCFVGNDTIYFASDGLGGPGGFDLYYIYKKQGRWSRAIPLNEINTINSESDPCIIPNVGLIFASDRPGGKGGLDLWKSEIKSQDEIIKQQAITQVKLQSYFSSVKFKYFQKISNPAYIPTLNFDSSKSENFDQFYKIQHKDSLAWLNNFSTNSVINNLKISNKESADLFTFVSDKIEINQEEKNEKNSKHYADTRLTNFFSWLDSKYLNENNNRSESLIKTNFEFEKEKLNYALLIPRSSNLLEFNSISSDSVIADPNIIALNVNSDNPKDVLSWSVFINSDFAKTKIFNSDTIPKEFIVSLDTYKKEFTNRENISFILESKLKNSIMIYDTLNLEINKTEFRSKNNIKFEGKNYNVYSFYCNEKYFKYSKILEEVKNKIKNANFAGKSVYFIDSQKNSKNELIKLTIDSLQEYSKNGFKVMSIDYFSNLIPNYYFHNNLITFIVES